MLGGVPRADPWGRIRRKCVGRRPGPAISGHRRTPRSTVDRTGLLPALDLAGALVLLSGVVVLVLVERSDDAR